MGKVKMCRVLGLANQLKMLKGRFCTSAMDAKRAVHWKRLSMSGSDAKRYRADTFWHVDRMQNKHEKMSLTYYLTGAILPEYLLKSLETHYLWFVPKNHLTVLSIWTLSPLCSYTYIHHYDTKCSNAMWSRWESIRSLSACASISSFDWWCDGA